MDDFSFLYDENAFKYVSKHNFLEESQTSNLEVEQEPGEANQSVATRDLPLLRSGDVEPDRVYDKENPTCIHYDLKLEILKRGIGKKRSTAVDVVSKRDLVLAPSDLWEEELKDHVAALLIDPKNILAGSSYTSKGTVAVKVKNSKRNLDAVFGDEGIPWAEIDEHLASFGSLFKRRRMLITVAIKLTYQETEATTATQTAQRNSATNRQRAQLDPLESVFMTRVYDHYQCRGAHCRQNSLLCLVDEKGNHHAIDNETIREIYDKIRKNVKEGENLEDVQNVEVPADIRNKILRMSKKRKANSDASCRSHKSNVCPGGSHTEPLLISGNPTEIMRDYCAWNLRVLESDEYRDGVEAANRFAIDERLDLNSIHQNQIAVKDEMRAKGIPLGSALRFVSNIREFIESRESETE